MIEWSLYTSLAHSQLQEPIEGTNGRTFKQNFQAFCLRPAFLVRAAFFSGWNHRKSGGTVLFSPVRAVFEGFFSCFRL